MMNRLDAYQTAYCLWKTGKLAEAERGLREMWQRSGARSLREALLLAYVLRDGKRYVSQADWLRQLLAEFAASPEKNFLAEAWSLLGGALRRLGAAQEAVEAFLQSIALEPDPEQKLVECSNAIFAANAVSGDSCELFHKLYAKYQELLDALHVVSYPKPSWHHEKIRVGYLSADLRDHAVAQFVQPLFQQYDANRFEVYVYSLVPQPDPVTEALRQSPVIWRDVAHIASFGALAERIRADEIDILFDLGGHSSHNALPVFAWRAAPVQMSGIGYFNSTGIRQTDGFLTDAYCSPEALSPYFVEPLLRLPHSHFCYAPFSRFPDIGALAADRQGHITFGCFNNFAKVTDEMLRLWARILQAVPGSHLLLKHELFDSVEGRAYTVKRMQSCGVPVERVEMRGLSRDYLAQYRDMDIALDTSPYPGGLTTCEALCMGVPVVTLTGGRHGARFGYSFLSNLGMPELAAATPEAYIALAVQLASDRELLHVLHQQLRPMMLRSPIMNGAAYMRDLEGIYMEQLHQAEKTGGSWA